MNGSVLKTALASSMLLALAACSDLDKLNSGVNTNESRLTENPEKGTSSSASGNGAISGEMLVFLSENELSGCTDSKEGLAVWVVDKASVYTCKNGRWEGSAESSLTEDLTVYKDEEALPNCTESREGAVAYLSDKKQLFTCNDGRWVEKKSIETVYIPVVTSSSSTILFPTITSSSSVWTFPVVSSSSIAVVFPGILSSSSSVLLPIRSSSSTVRSSTSTLVKSKVCGDMWCGADGVERVDTGLDYGADNSGYWFAVADEADGGASYVTWPVSLGNEYNDYSMQPVVEYCGGVCGTYTLDKGILDYDPFVIIGFNVAGADAYGSPYMTDASSWGGVCIVYSSEMSGSLELGLGNATDKMIGYANPMINLPKAPSGNVVDVPWSKFAQPGWEKPDQRISIADAVASLAQVKIKFQGKTGSKGSFNITSIGRYGSCTGTVVRSSSSSSRPRSSSSKNSVRVGSTWYGVDGNPRVDTGLDAGYDNSGYWFYYADDMDGGASTISWAVPLGDEFDDNSMQPVIDYCGGVCGEFELDKGVLDYDPFVGIGINVGGQNASGKAIPVDASSKSGVCIAYTVTSAAILELGLGDYMDTMIGYANPAVDLVKSNTGNVVNVPWSKFKQPGWALQSQKIDISEAVSSLATIKVKIQGKTGTTGSFNIKSIGDYNGGCSLD